jgi:hypothetical protein
MPVDDPRPGASHAIDRPADRDSPVARRELADHGWGMSPSSRAASRLDPRGLRSAQRRFSEIFPGRFRDETYVDWERTYKWQAHQLWSQLLGQAEIDRLLRRRRYREIGARAIAVYARPKLNLLALYEWMALREALADDRGARRFAPALRELIYGAGPFRPRFEQFVEVLDDLPQRQTRLRKWPVVTLYPFVALPDRHLVVKPNLMKRAAASFGADIAYASRPGWDTYAAVLRLAGDLRAALATWRPRDLIDVQGFIWVTHSDEYADWPWQD